MSYLDDYYSCWNKEYGCRRNQTPKQSCDGWSGAGKWWRGWWQGSGVPSPQENGGVEGVEPIAKEGGVEH